MNTKIRGSSVVLLILFFLSLPACSFLVESENASTSYRSRSTGGFKKGDPKDQYLAVQAKKKASTAFAFLQAPRDVWGPFRVETTVGLFDAKRRMQPGRGFMGIELDDDQSAAPSLRFYGLFVQVSLDGLQAFGATHEGNLGNVNFPGASALDLAIETDDDEKIFLARVAGSGGEYTEVDRIEFVQTHRLIPGLGVFGFAEGEQVGFDNFRVASDSPPPGPLNAVQTAVRAIWLALDPQIQAGYELDGAAPDPTSAATHITNSLPLVDQAIEAVRNVAETAKKTPAEKALSAVEKWRKKLNGVLKKLEKGKKPASVRKSLEKALKPALSAILALAPSE